MDSTRPFVIPSLFATAGIAAFDPAEAARVSARQQKSAPIPAKDSLKVTRLETFLVKPRCLFRKQKMPEMAPWSIGNACVFTEL